MSVGRFLQQAAAGNAGGATYVDDVFSTYVYTSNGSGRNIVNGIDLDGEGGLVWSKIRAGTTGSHCLIDTERGVTKNLHTNAALAENTQAGSVTAFNSDGYTIGTNGLVNYSTGYDYASWTFRKQPGFFDVVTYTGDGVAGRTVSHNLESVPGMIIVKRLDATNDWQIYHRGADATAPEDKYLVLNSTVAAADSATRWNDTAPTSTEFTLGSGAGVNASGSPYVAYLFAHDAQEFGTGSDESIIKCGSYTGNGSTTGPVIDLGFEPQWLLIKRSDSTGSWFMWDAMRGLTASSSADPYLLANTSNAEAGTTTDYLNIQATGFQLATTATQLNTSGGSYIYMAIRRPHKPAEEFAATDLFAIDTSGGTSPTPPRYTSGFPVDLVYQRTNISATNAGAWWTRLTASLLYPSLTDAESTSSSYAEYFAENEGFQDLTSVSSTNYAWMFRRAPGFFDVVAYTGTGSTRTVSHNLGVAPELMIIKGRTPAYNWQIYAEPLGNTKKLEFTTAASGVGLWNSTSPTDSVFTVSGNNNVNQSLDPVNKYIAYLFATVPGISKVGSYTGTGSDVDVDCGFTSGARFVLVKRTDSTGDWYLWDTERGIVAGNDPYLLLNSTAAQVTSTDYIDPLSSGFTITSSAPAALNNSGGTYIFLAIA